jgi:hypothetical protein
MVIVTFSLSQKSQTKNTGVVLSSTPKQISYPLEPQKLVEQFYQDYDYCLKTPPSSVKGNVNGYCMNTLGPVSKNFIKNIQNEGAAQIGVDPITCSKNSTGGKLIVDSKVINDGSITHMLVINKQSSMDQPIDVQLIQEDESMKIDTIVCQ